QGPILLQQLALLKGFDLAAMDPLGAPFVHTVVECAKLAFADREAWFADPDFVDVPMTTLLGDAYIAERRRLVGDTASLELRSGRPDGREPRLFAKAAGHRAALAAGIGEPTMSRDGEALVLADGEQRGDTCHVDVVDRWGNMISATPSGGWLQSSPVIPELGFGLNTRAQMFWIADGLPTSMAPGRRPRTTLSPSFALKDGAPYMAFGTPGGDQQDQWSTIFFLRHVHFGMNLQEAIDAPSFHTEHMPSSFYPREARPGTVVLEGRMPAATAEALRRRGHTVEIGEEWSEGRLSACAVEPTPDGTILKAAANPRGMQGYAVGR
ncbi:MAG TPA: gamma-glutamyltransferase, partial [Thermomicrobiales bacterium]|nr:gamma-glutamyltransferase [Thermomicrobiales bacterium]